MAAILARYPSRHFWLRQYRCSGTLRCKVALFLSGEYPYQQRQLLRGKWTLPWRSRAPSPSVRLRCLAKRVIDLTVPFVGNDILWVLGGHFRFIGWSRTFRSWIQAPSSIYPQRRLSEEPLKCQDRSRTRATRLAAVCCCSCQVRLRVSLASQGTSVSS